MTTLSKAEEIWSGDMRYIPGPQHRLCPICNSAPTLLPEFWGHAKYVRCEKCGWEGNTRDIERSADSALYHWDNKVDDYNKNKTEGALWPK